MRRNRERVIGSQDGGRARRPTGPRPVARGAISRNKPQQAATIGAPAGDPRTRPGRGRRPGRPAQNSAARGRRCGFDSKPHRFDFRSRLSTSGFSRGGRSAGRLRLKRELERAGPAEPFALAAAFARPRGPKAPQSARRLGPAGRERPPARRDGGGGGHWWRWWWRWWWWRRRLRRRREGKWRLISGTAAEMVP